MKILGAILTVIGAGSTIIGFLGITQGYSTARGQLYGGMMFLVLGIFLISRAKKKEKEKQEKKKWEEQEN